MRKKSHSGEEAENSERWLLTYADLITLLLGLFVILYAMSKVDQEKYQQLVAVMGGVFRGGSTSMLEGGKGVIQPAIPLAISEKEKIVDEIKTVLESSISKGLVSVTVDQRGITVHMLEELLFPSGSARLKESSLVTLDTLASTILHLPNDVRVEGHTDDVPIHTAEFPSNWHLSVDRAVNTAHYIMEKQKIDPGRLSVIGYSEYKPLMQNDSELNRSRNRRVDIIILLPPAKKDAGQK